MRLKPQLIFIIAGGNITENMKNHFGLRKRKVVPKRRRRWVLLCESTVRHDLSLLEERTLIHYYGGAKTCLFKSMNQPQKKKNVQTGAEKRRTAGKDSLCAS